MMPLTDAAAIEQESPASHEDPSGIRRIHGTAGSTSPRLTIDLSLTSESQLYAGLSGDMSEGGVFIETYRSLPLGTMVELDIELPDETVTAIGTVRWIREPASGASAGVGVAFVIVSPAATAAIERFSRLRSPLYVELEG
jgi:uncharacterized protein (TIGR02266 family)